MAPLGPGSPFRPRSRGRIRADTSPPPVPAKTVANTPKNFIDLNSSTRSADPIRPDRWATQPGRPEIARRAFLCDVIVDYDNDETNVLLSRLGEPLPRMTTLPAKNACPTTPRKSEDDDENAIPSLSSLEEQQRRLQSLIEELVRTERSYVSRLRALKKNYADPLRHFAKQSSTSIIPAYEAKVLFGNIDAVLPAAETFLAALETMWASGQAESLVGDMCLEHIRTLKTLDPYRTYIGNQDEAQKMFQDMFKRMPRFVTFIDSTKYQTTNIGNIGLRELLMEPVQRIPRYTLLWQAMAKCMSPLSRQRANLLEATDLASRIARCEADEQTVRATVMYCLQRNIDGFPANLFSNNRDYLDCIDAEDHTVDGVTSGSRHTRPRSIIGTASSISSLGASMKESIASPQKDAPPPPLHTTLFLFDDKLMITKRQTSTSGRKVTGLDDVQGLVKSGGGVAIKEKDGSKRAKLGFRGVVDIMDIMVADLGNGDFLLLLEKPPTDQSERWTLPLRTFSAVNPPHAASMNLQGSREDKRRFVHSIWAAQALSRTKVLPSNPKPVPYVLLSSQEIEIEAHRRAKLYWNIWGANGWITEPRKAKVLIEIVPEDHPNPIGNPAELGVGAVLRLQPMSGDVCFLSFASITGDTEHRTMLDMQNHDVDVNKEIATRINNLGVFEFPERNPSISGRTPSTLSRRAARNMFSGTASSRTGSSDAFDSMSTKGSQSMTSRTSTMDNSRSSHARSMSSGRVTPSSPRSFGFPRSPRSPVSPGARSAKESEDEDLPPPPPLSKDDNHSTDRQLNSHGSEMNLNARLNEARLNSRSMNSLTSPVVSRVQLMRQEVEERERRARESSELVASPISRPASPSKIPLPHSPAKANVFRRGPVPTLAASIASNGGGSMTRDSSLSSLPQSPSKSHGLSRTDTLSPRGPRGPPSPVALRSGYKPPLPPPTSSEEVLDSRPPTPLPKSPMPSSVPVFAPAGETVSLDSPTSTPPVSVMSHVAAEPPTTTTTSRPLPIPPIGQPVTTSRLIGLGAAPRLRVLSGGRRSVSGNRPPAASDENTSPNKTALKRQHKADHLSPRKRVPSDSTASRMERELTPNQEQKAQLGLGSAPGSRKASAGRNGVTPRNSRRSSGALTPSRRVSAVSVASLAASEASAGTVCTLSSVTDDFDVIMSEHPDLPSAADSSRQHIDTARKQARSVRKDAVALRKHMTKSQSQAEQGSLPRSPARHNIKLLPFVDLSHSRGNPSAADLARSIATNTEALEMTLAHAMADTERVRMLARQVADTSSSVAALEAQLERAKEREDLLRRQLATKEIEVDEIYNAFNAELDGMYSDITLPTPSDVEAAMRRDLQAAKAKRNDLDLENHRLRHQLEEERLRREQMGRVVRADGYE